MINPAFRYNEQVEKLLDEAYERFVAKKDGSTKQRKRTKQNYSKDDQLLEVFALDLPPTSLNPSLTSQPTDFSKRECESLVLHFECWLWLRIGCCIIFLFFNIFPYALFIVKYFFGPVIKF